MKTGKITQLTLPGIPRKTPTEAESRKSGKSVWWYVHDARNKRMLSLDCNSSGWRWVGLDLTNSDIYLWNFRENAARSAAQVGGKVSKYPYDVGLMRRSWKASESDA